MWFKKKSVLLAEHHYDTEKSADGTTDLRTTWDLYNNSSFSINNSGLPSAADAGNYFYLPALGYYTSDYLTGVGGRGDYWSSSAYPGVSDEAYALHFGSGFVSLKSEYRYYGYRVGGFK